MNKECIRRELTMEVTVGAFMAMVMFGLAYFTIVLSAQRLFTEKHRLEVTFDNVMGLRDGDNVVVRGMPIGKVSMLELSTNGVHVVALLDQPVHVREGYRMSIVSTSILGGRYLQIDEGPEANRLLAADTVFLGESAYDLMADAAEVINKFKQEFVEGGIVDNLKAVSEDLKTITGRLEAGEGTFGKLLTDEKLHGDLSEAVASLKTISENLEAGKGTLGKLLSDDTLHQDLSSTVASLKTVSDRLEKGEGTLGKLLVDDTFHQDLSATVASLRTVADRLEKGQGTIGKLFAEDDTLYADLADAVASLKTIAKKIEDGDGLIGKMVTDDSLYIELQELVGEVREAVDDFRETAPITTFTSVFFGAF